MGARECALLNKVTMSINNEVKYDRQLRLWGAQGQKALENTRLCLLNAGATGTEVLKNLVLPGIGHFTIVDGERVTAADVGNNFFINHDSIGKSRAEVTTELLQELNDQVQGVAHNASPDELVSENLQFLKNFDVIVATNLKQASVLTLSTFCKENAICLVVVRAYGLVGYIRIQKEEHTIIESKPENFVEDLRVLNPFPALSEIVANVDLATLDDAAYEHVPYVVILMKALEQYKATHNGAIPTARAEKDEFKTSLKQMSRDGGVITPLSNIDEAFKACLKCLNAYSIPSEVKSILQDDQAKNLTAKSPPFWIVARAIADFVANEGAGMLPLSGTIPDMVADTTSYITLQRAYLAKAEEDYQAVVARVVCLCQIIGVSPDGLDATTKLMCKNSAYLKLIRYNSIANEYNTESQIGNFLWDPDMAGHWYVLFRAVDVYAEEHGAYPGVTSENGEAFHQLKKVVTKVLQDMKSDVNVKDELIQEMIRFGASEIHNIGSVMGGVAAQECIKLITGQFVPMNNTFVFDGVTGTSSTMQL
eukprot:GFYU01000981.1.p1 GENE.GFYU01000981.1~~GFYU01000981.1.p1  ORF type:complete len:536 (-),score=164.70 GFYU01000981.1:18-1625(-)